MAFWDKFSKSVVTASAAVTATGVAANTISKIMKTKHDKEMDKQKLELAKQKAMVDQEYKMRQLELKQKALELKAQKQQEKSIPALSPSNNLIDINYQEAASNNNSSISDVQKKLLDANNLLKQGLISQEDFNNIKNDILKSSF